MGWASGEMVWSMEQKIPGISKFPGKRTTGCPYIWFYTANLGWIDRALKIWKTRPVEILIGRWKQCSLDDLDKKDTRRSQEQICLPVDNWPLTTLARTLLLPSVLFERSIVSMAFWPRIFRNFRSELTRKKIFLANVTRLQLSRKCVGRIGIHLFFDSMKELGH